MTLTVVSDNSEPTSLDADLDRLAEQLIKHALGDDCVYAEKLDIFKIVSQHRLNLSKLNKKKNEDDGDGSDFSSIKKRIAAAKEE
jgi:hypothetical protein